MGKNVYQIRIKLKDTHPLIWRRIAVPDDYTFWDFHVAIQDAMGWQDYHLHEYRMKNESFRIGVPDMEFDEDPDLLAGWEVPISKYLKEKGDAIEYVYDFGDYWVHNILLEAIHPVEEGFQYPKCIEGERNCPPEDCGGILGYEYLLEVLANPDHEEHDKMKAWLGGNFDPNYFNCMDVEFTDPKERLEQMFD